MLATLFVLGLIASAASVLWAVLNERVKPFDKLHAAVSADKVRLAWALIIAVFFGFLAGRFAGYQWDRSRSQQQSEYSGPPEL